MWREYFRMARRALGAHRFRSSLTVLSITVGAFAIVVMSSLAKSGLSTLTRALEEMGGARILFIVPKNIDGLEAARYGKGITEEDTQELYARVPQLAAHTAMTRMNEADVSNHSGDLLPANPLGGDEQTLKALGLRLAKGRSLRSEDVREHAKVCVVADEVAKTLFGGDAVGQWVTHRGLRCLVVGQVQRVERWGMSFGFEWNRFVLAPRTTRGDLNPETLKGPLLYLVSKDVRYNDLVKRVAAAVLSDRHRGVSDFEIWDFARLLAPFHRVFAVMQLVVGLIAGIALLVGGIGVMNMMLVSVSERVREIGIRKALGASPGAIQSQFLWEASLLSTTGGACGVTLGVATATLANFFIGRASSGWSGEISLPATVVAAGVSLLLGLAFGFLPARQAARLQAMEAIRT